MEKLIPALWILFAIGVFIYRMLKKAAEATAQDRRERPVPKRRPGPTLDRDDPAIPALPDTSFQELLRQMQARNAEKTADKHTPAGRPLPVETVPTPHSLERTEVEIKSLEKPATSRPINPPKPVVRLGENLPRAVVTARVDPTFAEYEAPAEARRKAARAVHRLLRQPASVRAAFVLSEVFQRRY